MNRLKLALSFLLATCQMTLGDQAGRYGLPNDECETGWIALFDGHSLFGWKSTSDANWKVNDGTISVNKGDSGFLHTTTQFADFELTLEYKCQSIVNSGIFVRSSKVPKDPSTDCYEINIAPAENRFPTGSIVARQKSAIPPSDDSDQWHTLSITAIGKHIQVSIDGERTTDFEDSHPLGCGYIALQFRGGAIAFRSIKLRPLGMESLFNGHDLTGWNADRADKSRFFVDEGLLRVQDGRGQLETNASYGNFVLQLECKTHAPNLNSGIFFRCIPGDQMMGYESQIHNGFNSGDRTKPADCGTGGIFRRQEARYVVADDLTWFTKTLIAHDDHVSTWVNGYQVADWTDLRKPHENPRKGVRTKAGTIMIQGHDPTTDLSFRNLKISATKQR